MAGGAVSLRYFILGLLTQQSMSGYDIKRFLKGLSWLIGSPGGGSLYPVLRALREEELVTVDVVPGIDRPPRKIYSITRSGQDSLRAWIEQPVAANAALKAFVMRLLLADSHSRAGLIAYLQQRRVQVATHHASLVDALDQGESLNQGQLLALGYGQALAAAELDWLDSTLSRLPDHLLSEEDTPADNSPP